jgi:rhodanese-related sulfurtransferase
MQNLSPSELKAWLDDPARPRPLLLDVREGWEFERCHIEGATLVPMSTLQMRLGELDPQRETVVICHHGVRSFHVARFLEQSGFARIVNLSGGVAAWAKDVDRSMPTY